MGAHLNLEIQKLKTMLSHLCTLVEEAMRESLIAIAAGDTERALRIRENDNEIDRTEIEIEEECLKILALHQPVAFDLRFVIACLKMNNDLERIGDLACNIAQRADSAAVLIKQNIPIDFSEMGNRTQIILKRTLDALFNMDKKAAFEIVGDDDIIDEMNRRYTRLIAERIRIHPAQTEEWVYLLGVPRNLERIADVCTNIAEDIIYMINGSIVRHQPK